MLHYESRHMQQISFGPGAGAGAGADAGTGSCRS